MIVITPKINIIYVINSEHVLPKDIGNLVIKSDLWHKRLDHLSEKACKFFQNKEFLKETIYTKIDFFKTLHIGKA